MKICVQQYNFTISTKYIQFNTHAFLVIIICGHWQGAKNISRNEITMFVWRNKWHLFASSFYDRYIIWLKYFLRRWKKDKIGECYRYQMFSFSVCRCKHIANVYVISNLLHVTKFDLKCFHCTASPFHKNCLSFF